jgi:hypothetical protein
VVDPNDPESIAVGLVSTATDGARRRSIQGRGEWFARSLTWYATASLIKNYGCLFAEPNTCKSTMT